MLNSESVIWVVTTDSNICRIYQYNKKSAVLTLQKELQHPENRLRDIDLTSDKPGHFKASNGAHGSYSQQSDPKEIKIDNFSKEIAKTLDHNRNIQAFDQLIIIAAPHMKGLLFQNFNKHVKDLITHTIEKDLIHLPQQELLAFLKTHTQYPDET